MVRLELEDVGGRKTYSEYRAFHIDGENENYRLRVSSYSGTVRDSLSCHNRMQFSTKDRGNDKNGANCSAVYHGAWWYNPCHHSNLNGKYINGPNKTYADGVNWYHMKGH